MPVFYAWRGEFTNDAVNRLHAEAFEHRVFSDDWRDRLNRYSLGWVCAEDGGELVGFVNVVWDGAIHAFILDTIVAAAFARQGIATQMISVAVREARDAGCEWLHVDFESHLRAFYFDRCGFKPADAGLIQLKSAGSRGS